MKNLVVSGKHSMFTHFPKDRNCDICLRTKNFKGFLQETYWYSRGQSGKFGDLITADHKVLSEGSESRHSHRYAVVVQDLATQWIQSYPCKTKTSWETEKSSQKFLEPTRKPKVNFHWNLANLVKTLPGIIVRQHRTDRKLMRLLREQCAESRKGHLRYCCNQVWTKNGGQLLWNSTPICEAFRILLDGKTPCERRFGVPFKSPEQWLDITPFLRKTYRGYIHLAQKSCQVFLGYVLYAGRIWKGDILVADIEELEQMDASEINAKGLSAKEVSTPMIGEKFMNTAPSSCCRDWWSLQKPPVLHRDLDAAGRDCRDRHKGSRHKCRKCKSR